MAHVFDGKLYFTRDYMQGNFIPKILSGLSPNQPLNPWQKHLQRHLQVVKKDFQAEHENFMFQKRSCVCMPLGMWVEVKVHSYLACTHVCAGNYMCHAQAMALSQQSRRNQFRTFA